MTQLSSSETKWKKALSSIVEELTEPQLMKMLFLLNNIPQGMKSEKRPVEIPQIIINCYGVEDSITAIQKVMKEIPRMDAPVQDLLRPHVEKLKIARQKHHELIREKAAAAQAQPVAKKIQPAAGTQSKLTPASGSVSKKQKVAADQQKSQPAVKPACLPKAKAAKAQSTTQKKVKAPVAAVQPKQKPPGSTKPAKGQAPSAAGGKKAGK